MKSTATVNTVDLEMTIDYLEGLLLILDLFANERRGVDGDSPLMDELQQLEGFGSSWDQLRYQLGIGIGWTHMAETIAEVRDRLLAGYSQAAL